MYRHEMIFTANMPIKLIVHQENITNPTALRHWHQALEINYVVNGKAKYMISGKSVSIGSGGLVIINPNEIHTAQGIITGDNNLALTFQFPYEFLKHEIPDIEQYWFMSPKEGTTSTAETKQFEQALYQYYLDSKAKKDILLLKSEIYQILYDLLHYFGISKNKIPNFSNPPTLRKLAKIVLFINEHCTERLTLPDLAEQSHLSVGYLSRTFSDQMGMSIIEYVNFMRVRQAYELLTDTEKTIETISDLTGFANPKSFRRYFEKIYGKTPGKYRYDIKGHKTT